MKNLLLIDKDAGWTSNDVVSFLKNRLPERPKKIGHAGTLDPFATGLLLIMINEETKNFDKFQTLKKEYIAEIEFGGETDTYDITGEIVNEFDGEITLDKESLEKILKESFFGKITQIPPKYSALKINGKPAYKYAREGKEVDIKKREVEIYEFEILDVSETTLKLRILVSSGTYIRSIAYDLGKILGYGAYLKSLRRTKIGNYNVEDAVKLDVYRV